MSLCDSSTYFIVFHFFSNSINRLIVLPYKVLQKSLQCRNECAFISLPAYYCKRDLDDIFLSFLFQLIYSF